jgi:predicted O-methyltransferase YrrM
MLNWTGDDSFVLDDAAFRTFPSVGAPSGRLRSDEFLLMKPPWMIEEYVTLLANLEPRNIFELGIHKGGSTAFLALAARPAKLVAVDLKESSSDLFAAWLRSPAAENVRTYFGVDQANAVALREIVAQDFAGEQLDLVIDDASHLFGPSKASLNALLPYVRPGGIYVIEDWAGEHMFEARSDLDPAELKERLNKRFGMGVEPPLTLLLFEALLALAYTGVVDDIRARRNWVAIRRGPDPIAPGQFEISECYLQLGRDLLNGV